MWRTCELQRRREEVRSVPRRAGRPQVGEEWRGALRGDAGPVQLPSPPRRLETTLRRRVFVACGREWLGESCCSARPVRSRGVRWSRAVHWPCLRRAVGEDPSFRGVGAGEEIVWSFIRVLKRTCASKSLSHLVVGCQRGVRTMPGKRCVFRGLRTFSATLLTNKSPHTGPAGLERKLA